MRKKIYSIISKTEIFTPAKLIKTIINLIIFAENLKKERMTYAFRYKPYYII